MPSILLILDNAPEILVLTFAEVIGVSPVPPCNPELAEALYFAFAFAFAFAFGASSELAEALVSCFAFAFGV
eukprot:12934117-Prorocentrum_lima.AAC.1